MVKGWQNYHAFCRRSYRDWMSRVDKHNQQHSHTIRFEKDVTKKQIPDNKMSNLITIKQAVELRELGYNKPTIRYAYRFNPLEKFKLQGNKCYITCKGAKLVLPIPTVDEVIDWFRRKHCIMIYECIEPFVDGKHITYGFRVKKCNVKWGWNHREYIGERTISHDIYAAKRMAIQIAIRYVKNKKIKKPKRNE